MKVFLAWSRAKSSRAADVLKKWLEGLFKGVRCWKSSNDIESGTYWHKEILKAVKQCKVGILCLTSDIYDAPWVMFEAGALWAGFHKKRVIPFLLDLDNMKVILSTVMICALRNKQI